MMSIEAAIAFVERMKTDEDFRNQVLACPNAAERKSFVQSAGYDFDVNDLKTGRASLSDADLEKVSGGGPDCSIDWSGACRWMLFDFI